MLWENLREEEFSSAILESGKVCVLPIGCLEMHGQHLPVGTDTKTCYYIAKEAAKIEPVCVFPGLYFGDVLGLYNWHGTIALSTELLLNLLTELCAEIARNGFKKILILNGHGGNLGLLQNFLRKCGSMKKDYAVMVRNDFQFFARDIQRELDGGRAFPELTGEDIAYLRSCVRDNIASGHADNTETSIMMEIDPELVRLDRASALDGRSTKSTAYLSERGIGIKGSAHFWLADYPNSFAGERVEGSSDRIGKAILRRRIELQAEAVRRIKEDDRVLEWIKERPLK